MVHGEFLFFFGAPTARLLGNKPCAKKKIPGEDDRLLTKWQKRAQYRQKKMSKYIADASPDASRTLNLLLFNTIMVCARTLCGHYRGFPTYYIRNKERNIENLG
jgi:hypothetical protein